MTFSCLKCGWKGYRKVQGRRFCTKCNWGKSSGTENLIKDEPMMFGPKESGQPLIDEQDSHDVDMDGSTPASNPPKYCYNCGNEFAFNHQVNFCDQCGAQQMRRTSSQSSSIGANGSDYVLPKQGLNISQGGHFPASSNQFGNTPLKQMAEQGSDGFQQMMTGTQGSSLEFEESENALLQEMNNQHSGVNLSSNNSLTHLQMQNQNFPHGMNELKYPPQRKTSLTQFQNSSQHAALSNTPPINQSLLQQDFSGNNAFATNTTEQMDSARQRKSFSGTPYERPDIAASSPRTIPSRNSSFSLSFSHESSIGLQQLFESQPSSFDNQIDSVRNQEQSSQLPSTVAMEVNFINQIRKEEPMLDNDISDPIQIPSAEDYSLDLEMNFSGHQGYMQAQPNDQSLMTNGNVQAMFNSFDQNMNNQQINTDAPVVVPYDQNINLNNNNPDIALSLTQLLTQNNDNNQSLSHLLGQSVTQNYTEQTMLQPFEHIGSNAASQISVQSQGQLPSVSSDKTLSQLLEETIDSSIPTHTTGSAGREINVDVDEYGDTVLNRYVDQNKTDEALQEIRRLADTYDKETYLKYINERNKRREVPLQNAIMNQNAKVIENLLENGVDVTVLNDDGNNIFHLIVLTSTTEEVALDLLRVVFKHQAFYRNEFNCLLNEQSKAYNNEGLTIVHVVTTRSYGNTLRFLHGNGANLNITGRKEKETAMVMASRLRNWPIVEILCELGACVNIPTTPGWYPVHAAIEDKDVARVKFFMDNGVDIFGYKRIAPTEKIKKLCDKYMTKRRRTSKNDKSGNGGGTKKRRCNCNSDGSQVSLTK